MTAANEDDSRLGGTPAHLKTLVAYLATRRGTAVSAAICIAALLASLILVAPWASALLRDVLPAADLARLSGHLLLGLALALVIAAASFGRDYLLMSLCIGFASSVRERLVAHLLRRPNERTGTMSTGEQLARVGSEMQALQQALVRGLAIGVPNTVTALCLIIVMVTTSAPLTVGTLLLAIPMLWLVARFGRRLHGMAHQSQRAAGEMLGMLGEAVDGLREVKVFGQEAMFEERVAALNRVAVRHSLEEERTGVLHPAAVTFLGMVGLAGLVFLAASLTHLGVVANADVVRFLILLGLAVGPLQESTRSTGAIARYFAIMDRVRSLLATPIEADPPHATPCPRLKGAIEFDGATIDRQQAGFCLGPLNLRIDPGEVVAIVGASGAGKSTLLDLVTRLLDPSDGLVRVDGTDIRRWQRASLRSQIALLPQEPLLFHGTLAENILFGNPNASAAQVTKAVADAHLEGIVARLPRGLNTEIVARGTNLSVGERQRIALARALVRDPRILLLDEPSAALDVESERLLIDSLRRFCAARTTLLVTHRPAMLALAHRVVMLERGKLLPFHSTREVELASVERLPVGAVV